MSPIAQNRPFTAHHSPFIVQRSSLIANDSLPKNLFLLFFCRKIHKTVHKNAKNSPKNRLVHSCTIAPTPIKCLIICYLILYTFVHCFPLSFLALILILQRKSLRTNKKFLFYDKENISLNLPPRHVRTWNSGASVHT